MMAVIYWILAIALIAGLIVAGYWYYRNYMSDGDGASGLFGARADRRNTRLRNRLQHKRSSLRKVQRGSLRTSKRRSACASKPKSTWSNTSRLAKENEGACSALSNQKTGEIQ